MICIISGTNRLNSNTLKIANLYAQRFNELNQTTTLLDLAQLPVDFTFSALYQNAGKNEAFNDFATKIKTADKYVFIVPEYNNSFPGVLKTFLDGLSFPSEMKNKKAALVGLSAGVQGGSLALSHLSDVLQYLGVHVFGLQIKLSEFHKHFQNGSLTNEVYKNFINQQIESFVAF